MQVSTRQRSVATAAVLPRQYGRAREHRWNLAPYVGHKVQIVLRDEDDRPGCHLFCSGFRLARQDAAEAAEFTTYMRQLESQHKLLPMLRYETKHFTSWSNAEDTFTRRTAQLRSDVYDVPTAFPARGFAVYPPATKLMVAVFDSQSGFEVYLGQKMPGLVTGVYSRDTNRLVIYDLQHNEQALNAREKAFQTSRGNDRTRSSLHRDGGAADHRLDAGRRFERGHARNSPSAVVQLRIAQPSRRCAAVAGRGPGVLL